MHRRITTHLPRPNPAPELEHSLLEHLPMVRFVARRIHGRLPRNVEIDDLFSAGMIGLMEASAKFNPEKGIKFASFASFRVRGAILDSLRISDWAPRQLRQRGRVVQETIRMLTARFKRAPLEDEVAFELKISLHAYQTLLADLHGLEIGTLHRVREDGSGDEELVYIPGPPEDDPLFRSMRGEVKQRMIEAIEELSERERLVTTLSYYEEMTMHEIGLTMGIDGIKVSQIRASAVRHLRSALADLAPRYPHRSKNPASTHSIGARPPAPALLLESAA